MKRKLFCTESIQIIKELMVMELDMLQISEQKASHADLFILFK